MFSTYYEILPKKGLSCVQGHLAKNDSWNRLAYDLSLSPSGPLYASGVQYCPKYAVRLNIRSYEWGKQSFITPPHITAKEALCVSHSELNLRLSRSAWDVSANLKSETARQNSYGVFCTQPELNSISDFCTGTSYYGAERKSVLYSMYW